MMLLYINDVLSGDSENVQKEGLEYNFKSDATVDYRFFNSETGVNEKTGTVIYEENEEELIIFEENKS